MEFSLTQEQQTLRKKIIEFAQKELNQNVQERDRNREFSREKWQKCAEIGLQGLPVPSEYGGRNLDPLSTAIALEALGYGSEDNGLNFSLSAHLLACVIPILKHGSEDQKKKYLRRLCDGTLIGVNATTETQTGSDSFAMQTIATPGEGGYRISGTKSFCTNAPVADLALIYAVTDSDKGYYGGITAFLVPTDSEGYQAGPPFEKMGLHTSPVGKLDLNDVFVPEENVLGGLGGGSMIFTESMDWERACLVACHVGTMERILENTVSYARKRKQYGQAIGKFQAVSHKIAEMKVRLEAARLLTYFAASKLDASRLAGLDAAIAKVYTSEALVQSTQDALHVMGGYGFLAENDVERFLRDAMASTIYSGTSEVQRNIIARWLGL